MGAASCLGGGSGLGWLIPRSAQAWESGAATIAPKEFGLDLPAGAIKPAKGPVQTVDERGQPVIARQYVLVGDNAIVMLPDGQLVTRRSNQISPSERPFSGADREKLAEDLTERQFPGFKSRVTRHYIFVYNTSDEFAYGTSRILETMLPGVTEYCRQFKLDVSDPQVPLVVVMFRTEEEFQRYRRMPDGVVAYYHTLNNRVFMYEQSRLARVRPDLAIQQSISTIAHEGAHQVLHNIGVQQRLSMWPMWLSEGMAEFLAPTATGAKLRWKGVGQINDLRMFELEQYIKSRSAGKPDGQMIDQTVMAARLSSTGYASAWSLVHYLAKMRRPEFQKYLQEVSRLGPLETAGESQGPGIVRENRTLFIKHFGEDSADIEARLIAYLKKQPYLDPFKDLPHFVAIVQLSEGKRPKREINTFHSRTMATEWVSQMLEKVDPAVRDSAPPRIQQFPNRAAAEGFARQMLQQK
jgi:hypothetical protein